MAKFDPFGPQGPFAHIDENSVRLKAQFHIFSCLFEEDGKPKAAVAVVPGLDKDGKEPPFESWMTACEHFIGLVASKSEAGYEKALELLTQGAMKYRRHITGLGPNYNPLPPPEG